jgi:hypothetical protein
MAPQGPEPKLARGTTLSAAIRIGLDEATTALEESLLSLTEEHVWGRYALPGRHKIGTIVMHSLANLNDYGIRLQGGHAVVDAEECHDMWTHTPHELAPLQRETPTVAEMVALVQRTCEALFDVLAATTEEQLLLPRSDAPWFERFGRTAADAYMRTIMHTMAHVRQVWFLRGALGLTDRDGWPEQHWA